MRVSNFLLWQIAYAEIHVTTAVADFRCRHLLEAVLDYQKRTAVSAASNLWPRCAAQVTRLLSGVVMIAGMLAAIWYAPPAVFCSYSGSSSAACIS